MLSSVSGAYFCKLGSEICLSEASGNFRRDGKRGKSVKLNKRFLGAGMFVCKLEGA